MIAQLPADPIAEQQVIAFALSDPAGRDELLAALAAEDFVSPPRGRVWEAMQEVAARQGATELIEALVRDQLRQADPHSQESLAALEACRTVEVTPDPLGTARMELAAIVRRLSQQRQGIAMLLEGLEPLYQRDCNPVDAVAGLGAVLCGLAEDWQSGNGHQKTSTNSTFHRSRSWPDPPHEAAYYGLAGDVVRALEPETESDPAALLAQFFTYFAAHIGPQAHFEVGKTRHALNLYTMLIGPSGRGRKGTSRDCIEGVYKQVVPGWTDRHVLNGLSSGEGLIAAVRDREDAANATKEVLLLESEFAGPLEHMSRQGNILSVVLRQLWEADFARTLTRHDPLSATGVYLSLIGHITEDDLVKHMTSTLAGDGLGNRVLWFCSKRARLLPFGGNPHPAGLDALEQPLKRAIELARNADCIGLNEPAQRLWERVYQWLTRDRPGLCGKLTGRAEAQTRRLAALSALLDGTTMVRPEHLRQALAVWDYSERSVAYVFGDALGDKLADQLLAAIRASGRAGMLTTDLYDLVGHKVKAETLHQKLDLLKHHGLVTSRSESAKGNSRKLAERWFATVGAIGERWKVELVEAYEINGVAS